MIRNHFSLSAICGGSSSTSPIKDIMTLYNAVQENPALEEKLRVLINNPEFLELLNDPQAMGIISRIDPALAQSLPSQLKKMAMYGLFV